MLHSEQINEIATALAKAQGMIEGASKAAVNPAFGKKYADLASVWDAAREPLSINGLSVVQIPNETPDGMLLVTMLLHSSGQWFSSRYPIRPVKNDPQGIGSAITYARRYSLMALVGIAPEDDDGNIASGQANVSTSDAKASPSRTAPQNNGPDPRAIADTIKHAIDAAADLAGVNDVMRHAGQRPGSDKPATGSDLETVKRSSEQAFRFLIDRAANKRSTYVGDPAEDDEQKVVA